MENITTGLKSMDKLLDGGLPSNTVTLLAGGPGTGKTLMSLNFLLEGAKNGEKCYYLSFNERKEDLIRAASRIRTLKLVNEHLDKNLQIEFIELNDKINTHYLSKIFREYPHIDRLVIDNVNKMMLFSENKAQYRKLLSAIVNYLRRKVKCTILICETKESQIDNGGDEAFECDGVIKMSFSPYEERPVRTLEIYKMRYCSFEPKISHEVVIDDKGIKLTAKKLI